MSRRSPHDSSRTRPTGWSRRDALRPLASAALLPLLGGGALAQVYPARQISMVFPAAAASPSDLVGRHLAKAMAAQTTVPIVADNRPGANGLIGVQAVQNALADGHTLLFTTMSTMAVNKALIKALPYEPLKDFVPLGVMYRTWLYVCVNAKLPFKSMAELVAHAKQNPGKLNFGYGTSIPQMAGQVARSPCRYRVQHDCLQAAHDDDPVARHGRGRCHDYRSTELISCRAGRASAHDRRHQPDTHDTFRRRADAG